MRKRYAAKAGRRVPQLALSQRLWVHECLHGRRGLGHALPDHDARTRAAATQRSTIYGGARHEPGVRDARRRIAPQGLAGHDRVARVQPHYRG